VVTTLLGRIPAWSPPVAPVGPFRAVSLEVGSLVTLRHADVRIALAADHSSGQVVVTLDLQTEPNPSITAVTLWVGGASTDLALHINDQHLCRAQGTLILPSPQLWWPHTHGEPHRYPASVRITTGASTQVLDLDPIGFRTLHVDHTDGAFAVQINGIPIFCRGACWTPVDMVSLASTDADVRPTLTLARNAGMNMLRVGGTMVYESDAFYEGCDALGILVWQDFMFANMDYPVEDPYFADSIHAEALQFLNRIQTRACLAVLCGNSEIEQQSAMLGLTRELWCNRFFAETLPALCAHIKPDALYWPSSPSGGVLPFQVDHGVSHYYGVGAYLRPLEDARRAGVRFTTECLGFSNIPDESSVDTLLKHGGQAIHHPVWKARVPRDSGSGWDFEDVRDHYMTQLFRVDAMRLRYADMPRYLALARVTTGEVIAQTVTEWRRVGSHCQGALVWFLRDLWLGAGWGLIDATGQPKAAYWYTQRAMQPLTVFLTDEGLNGLEVHAINERPSAFVGELELALYRHGEVRVAHACQPITLPAHSSLALRADAMLAHFVDTAYAYRFGPAGHHLAVVTLRHVTCPETAQDIVAQSFHHPVGLPHAVERDIGLQAKFQRSGVASQEILKVVLTSQKFAQSVYLDIPGYLPQDNCFHMAPGSSKTVVLMAKPVGERRAVAGKLQGTAQALNAELPTKILHPPVPIAPH
jgi:beta-mannosidase